MLVNPYFVGMLMGGLVLIIIGEMLETGRILYLLGVVAWSFWMGYLNWESQGGEDPR